MSDIKLGDLAILKSGKTNHIFCWALKEDNRVDARIFEDKMLGVYLGIWELKTNGSNWFKIMINKEIYLFLYDQFEKYEPQSYTHKRTIHRIL
jgi:hypothetical protein